MKSLRFDFCHPVKVHACLTRMSATAPQKMHLLIDSKDSNQVVIPVSDCQEGKWKVFLDWEYEGHVFSHQKEFEVKKGVAF